jgi:hypothetical protein
MATSSAGVFNASGFLVRRLWEGVVNHPSAANAAAFWDGRLDDGTVALSGTYTVKTLSHNIIYQWEGVIGNTSPLSTHIDQIEYHAHGTNIIDMAITSGSPGEIYFIHGYDERKNTMHVCDTDNIQVPFYVLEVASRRGYNTPVACSTDHVNVYYGRFGGTNAYVFVVACADFDIPDNPGVKQQVHFPTFGVPEPGGNPITQADTAIVYADNKYIWDVSVQKTGNFLFVSRRETTGPDVHAIVTANKTTGQTLQTNLLGLQKQRRIAINPTVNNELWVIHSTAGTVCDKITKCSVNTGTGVVTTTATVITGLSDAVDLEISPDGATLLVSDGGSSQQVKAFNTSNGTIKTAFGTSGAFGTAGGYLNSPTVTNTKFMFLSWGNAFGVPAGGAIAFAADGSWWVCDNGNCRALHFSAGNSPAYVERIQQIPAFYSCREFRGDPTRVFSEWLEWSVNYAIPLGADNGSWTLAKNWYANIAAMSEVANSGNNFYVSMKYAGIYSNGRSYCFLHNSLTGFHCFELTATGLRNTGVHVTFQGNAYIDRNMDMWFIASNSGGPGTLEIRKNTFLGFDGSFNPDWQFDNDTVSTWPIVKTVTLPDGFPLVEYQLNHNSNLVELLSNGIMPVFNAHTGVANAGLKNHFGGFDYATGAIKFSTQPPTPRNFGLPFLTFPEAPYFGVEKSVAETGGQGVDDFGGGSMFYQPGHAHVFTQYPGESWGNNQTCVTSHWHESGLLLGQFGPAFPYFGDSKLAFPRLSDDGIGTTDEWVAQVYDAIPNATADFRGLAGAAGNSFQGGLTFVNGKYYYFQNDEWYHGGIHRWVIDGLGSLSTNTQIVAWDASSYEAPSNVFVYDPIRGSSLDLLAGLPYDTLSLPSGSNGWIRSPTSNITTGNFQTPPFFRVYTNGIKSNRFLSPDLAIVTANPGVTWSLYKDLPARPENRNWELNGEMWWRISTASMRILDATGKTIVKLAMFPETFWSLYVNDQRIASPNRNDAWNTYIETVRPFSIRRIGSTIAVSYGKYSITGIAAYEVGADLSAPFRVQIAGSASEYINLAFPSLLFVDLPTVPVWPDTIPHDPVAGAWQIDTLNLPPIATDMDGGNTRMRQRPGANVGTITQTIKMTRSQFSAFRVFVRDTLGNGAARFYSQVWIGDECELKECQFATQPTVTAMGNLMLVSMQLRVYGL